MLSRYNCCPDLVIGNLALRIFGCDIEPCPNLIIDGIIGHKESKPGSFFRRFLTSIEDHPDTTNTEYQLLCRYRLQREKISCHASCVAMVISDKINHVNVKRCYAMIKDHCYTDELMAANNLTDFLVDASIQQISDIIVQIVNLYEHLEQYFSVLAFDLLRAIKIQSLNVSIKISLDNGRELTTDTLVKLDNFDFLAIATHESEFYNISYRLPDHKQCFNDLRDYISNRRPEVPTSILGLLSQGSLKGMLLPKALTKKRWRCRDSNWFLNNNISTLTQLLEVFQILEISYTQNNPFIIVFLLRETKAIRKHLVNIKHRLLTEQFTFDDIEDPAIGFGTGVYEKKLVELLKIRSKFQAISSWLKIAEYLNVSDKKCRRRVKKIKEKLAKNIDRYQDLIQPIRQHRKFLKNCQDYRCYLEVYQHLASV